MIALFKSRVPRGPVVFSAGLLAAAGFATSMDGAIAQLSQAFGGAIELDAEHVGLVSPRALTVQEQRAAKQAWSYIQANTQPQTGFANSVDGYPSGTLWDQGSYLLGVVSAQRLGLITQNELDERVRKFLDSLAQLPLFDGRLPNKAYNTQTLAMVHYDNTVAEIGIGWSALDIARLLLALRVVEKHYPHHGEPIRRIMTAWDLEAMVEAGELVGAAIEADDGYTRLQEGRTGYEQYAARAAALWGLDVVRIMSAEDYVSWVEVEGVMVPRDIRTPQRFGAITPILSEPYLLLGFELGLDAESAAIASRLLDAQQARYAETGHITMVSEDHLNQAPYFAYSSVFANGRPWAVVTEQGEFFDDLRTQSVKASFGWDALFGTEYTQIAKEAVLPLADSETGFPAGIYEADGSVNDIFTLNTNGIILEALHYQAHGPLWATRVTPN